MHFVRKALLVLITPFFLILLYTTAIDVGFVRVGTHPATIKHILAESGVYQSVVPGLLDQAKTISGGGGDVNLGDPLIKSSAAATFTPQFVQTNAETVLDGTYDWLNGKTPVPDFQIDLTSAKINFANNVSKLVADRLGSLPACTTSAEIEGFDAMTSACLPPGMTAASAASTLQSNILGGKGFIDNPVITADSIKNGNNNQPVFTSKNVKKVPAQYQRAKKTPFILGLLTVLVALAIIFLNSSRAAGLRHVGTTLLIVGILLLVFAWGINHVVTQTVAPKLKLNNAVLQSSLRTLLIDVEQAIDKSYWWFGGAYVVLGVAAIGGSMRLKGGGQKNKLVTEAAGPAPAPAGGAHHHTAAATEPKPRRTIKIQ